MARTILRPFRRPILFVALVFGAILVLRYLWAACMPGVGGTWASMNPVQRFMANHVVLPLMGRPRYDPEKARLESAMWFNGSAPPTQPVRPGKIDLKRIGNTEALR